METGSYSPFLNNILSVGMIASWLPGGNSGVLGTFTIFLMGWLLEMGREAYAWFSERWRFQYSLTAEFSEGDPAYDWVLAFLSNQQVWRRSWNFSVSAKTIQRKNGVESSEISKGHISENAEYVPTYQRPQLFRWNRYWVEVSRSISLPSYDYQAERVVTTSTIYLTVYTRDVSAISALVEYARARYTEASLPHVIIHTSNSTYVPFRWNECKRKARRSLDSVILEAGVLDSLVSDACEFMDMEDWYHTAGIPYRRGYLLYGPPGTGKTSTIYALAGELGLEIYSLSLASRWMDDVLLASALACIPKRSIFLLEDIDCAFSRMDDASNNNNNGVLNEHSRCNVTLSGLLNVLDGVSTQEGILFFATTNHIEDLDFALLRAGRIDKKIQYHRAVKQQATTLYKRFFPISHCTPESAKKGASDDELNTLIDSLAEKFADQIPEKVFTTAELQGYLLTCKFKPEKAVEEVMEWVDNTLKEKKELEEKKKEKLEKAREKRDREEVGKLQSTLMKMNEIGSKQEQGEEHDSEKEQEIQDARSKEDDLNSPVKTPSSISSSHTPSSPLDLWTITESDLVQDKQTK